MKELHSFYTVSCQPFFFVLYFLGDFVMNYQEQEIKVLDIDVSSLCQKLENMGAKKVFDGDRVFTTFDTQEKLYLEKDILIRLTEEEKLKLSVSTNNSKSSLGEKKTVKLFVSRKEETIDFFKALGILPITEIKSHRISYELQTTKGIVDFDIDVFPLLPPFLEIDLENLDESLAVLLEKLGISSNQIVEVGTEEIYKMYGIDYFEKFKI